jgi:hypothetical protein
VLVEGIDAARLARGREGGEAREVLAGGDVALEEVVLPAEGDPAEGALRGVVVERHARILEGCLENPSRALDHLERDDLERDGLDGPPRREIKPAR